MFLLLDNNNHNITHSRICTCVNSATFFDMRNANVLLRSSFVVDDATTAGFGGDGNNDDDEAAVAVVVEVCFPLAENCLLADMFDERRSYSKCCHG